MKMNISVTEINDSPYVNLWYSHVAKNKITKTNTETIPEVTTALFLYDIGSGGGVAVLNAS